MKNFRWQLIIVLVTGLAVGLILYFHQSSPASSPANSPSPISGGIYTEALIGKFSRLNPLLDRYNSADQDVDRLIFSSLITFDSNGMPKGDLAESWSYAADGSVFTFSIKPNAFWHDGTPVSAQDILFTTSLLRSPSSLIPADISALWSEIQVNAISDLVVQFVLPEAFAPFLDYLDFRILPAHLLGNLTVDELVDHPFNLAPVGSGPYQFKQLIVTDGAISGVDLTANENYYDGRPYIDEIVFRYYPSEEAAWNAYQQGEADGISQVSTAILPQVLAQPGLNLYSAQESRLTMIFLNLNNSGKAFLQQSDFRKALLLATNRQALIDQVLMGQGILARGPIPPGNWAFYSGLEDFEYDADAARQLLAASGFTSGETGRLTSQDGTEVRLVLLTPDDPDHLAMAELIKKGWEAVGVAVDILAKPYEQVTADLQARNFDACLVDVDLSDSPDPDPYPFWGASQVESGQNYSHWVNLTASEYLEQARVQVDSELRSKLYRNFQVLFQEDLPSLPLFYHVYNYAVKDTVKNVSMGAIYSPADRFVGVREWYILASRSDGQTPTPGSNP